MDREKDGLKLDGRNHEDVTGSDPTDDDSKPESPQHSCSETKIAYYSEYGGYLEKMSKQERRRIHEEIQEGRKPGVSGIPGYWGDVAMIHGHTSTLASYPASKNWVKEAGYEATSTPHREVAVISHLKCAWLELEVDNSVY